MLLFPTIVLPPPPPPLPSLHTRNWSQGNPAVHSGANAVMTWGRVVKPQESPKGSELSGLLVYTLSFIRLIITVPQKESKTEPRWDGFQPMWLNLTFKSFFLTHSIVIVPQGSPRHPLAQVVLFAAFPSSDFFLSLFLSSSLSPHSCCLSIYLSLNNFFLAPVLYWVGLTNIFRGKKPSKHNTALPDYYAHQISYSCVSVDSYPHFCNTQHTLIHMH